MPDPKMLLLRAGQRVVAFNPLFAKISGCVKTGLFLSQALYWQGIVGPDVWFYKTQSEWSVETFLSRYEQETARKCLRNLRVLEEKLAGVPATINYRVNLVVLAERLTEWVEPPEPVGEQTTIQYAREPHTGLLETDKPYKEAEITTEITTEKNLVLSPPKTADEEKEPSRFSIFKEVVFRFYQWKWGRAPLWDGAEANQLSRLLKADPSLDVQTFSVWLKNYGSSQDISPGERPCMFLPRITKYSIAALNQFGREENVGSESKQDAIARRNREAFAQVRGGLPQPS